MIALAFIVGAVAALLAGGLAWTAGRARARALADDVRRHVEPYLKRKASEAGLEISHAPWTSRSRPEEIVVHASELADRLLAHEKQSHAPPTDIRKMALADTQQLAQDQVVTADLKKGKK